MVGRQAFLCQTFSMIQYGDVVCDGSHTIPASVENCRATIKLLPDLLGYLADAQRVGSIFRIKIKDRPKCLLTEPGKQ
jgi:hypothetical protein